jgi:flagellar biosynthetic protein FliO
MTTALLLRTSLSLAAVIGLLALLSWALRRGLVQGARSGGRAVMSVETALPLGDRRSLAIVTVAGRRFLLGLTPGSVSLIAEVTVPASAGSES